MPIHCCAMQGRIDALELMLQYDAKHGDEIRQALKAEDFKSPPSLIYLAVANDHLDTARW